MTSEVLNYVTSFSSILCQPISGQDEFSAGKTRAVLPYPLIPFSKHQHPALNSHY